jgi:Kef-type K+ transport system membrane component KefB
MNEGSLFFSLGWIVVGAAACMTVAKLIRLPSIVACLVAGLVLGPGLGLVEKTEDLDLLSEVGIVLLLFLVGLELSFAKIRQVGMVAVVAGLGQVVFTVVGGFFLCQALGFNVLDSLFVAAALTFSSTVVAVKLLTDKGELNDWYGRIAVANSLVQTLVVLLALVFINSLTEAGYLDFALISTSLLFSLGKIVILFGGTYLLVQFVLPKVLPWVASSPGAIFIWSLCWCFLVVGAAGLLGISLEIGALLAGLNLAHVRYSRDLQHRIKPLMNLFVAVFFVILGVQINVGEALAYGGSALLLALFVLVGNTFIFMVLIPRFGFSERTSFCAGVTGAQISEFSFIFVKLGLAAGLVGGSVVSVVALVGLVTISVSSYLILYNGPIYERLAKWGVLRLFRARGEDRPGDSSPERVGHIVVVGMNSLGRLLARQLHELGESVVALDTDDRKLEGLPCETMVGSSEYLDVLLEADLPKAKLLISALRIEEANELLAFRARHFGVPCCIHAVDISMVDNLLELDVDYLMLSKVDGIKLQTRCLREQGYFPA